jgi:hypothetical protein
MRASMLRLALTVSIVSLLVTAAYAWDGSDDDISPSMVVQGFAISPVSKDNLNLTGQSLAAVGLGSYFVNGASDCTGCHSYPQYLAKGNTAGSNPSAGDPFSGLPSGQSISTQLAANFNVNHYLAGGQCFGPFMARNLTPGKYGPVEGLTQDEFIKVMRTGEDIHCEKFADDPICAPSAGPDTPVLQVMPWPSYHSMTDVQLKAMYAYLSALPATEACNTVQNGCPGYWGDAATSAAYVYPDSADCPNPGPPQ